MKELRIVSFLPAATEMTCALGLADQLAGITHECDYPAEVQGKPVVVRSVLPVANMTPREIDAAVSQRIQLGGSLYEIDEGLLRGLAPTHILTQDLCHVCAPAGREIARAIETLPSKPEVVWFSPLSLEDICQNVLTLGEATGRARLAHEVVATMRSRLEKVAQLTRQAAARPRVFCLEWTDPYYCAGHWVPEMVQIAGGLDALGQAQGISTRVAWDDIEKWAPEVLVVMPCGFGLEEAIKQTGHVIAQPCWSNVPAVQDVRVFAVDANSYFARPGPRVAEGTELLAHLIHPDLCEWNGPANAFRSVSSCELASPSSQAKCCPKCGAAFACGPASGENGCWCNKLPHLPAHQISGGGCLCPTCLAKRIETTGSPPGEKCCLDTHAALRDSQSAFTLLELLVVIALIAVLLGLLAPALSRAKAAASGSKCISNLRQLGVATQMYWDDNEDRCFRYRRASSDSGYVYWFGWLEQGPEGQRTFDATQGALYPYLQGRGVEICPSLSYSAAQFKRKAHGAAYGYGYNLHLAAPADQPPVPIHRVGPASRIALYADAAQVNTFQSPASPENPMLEEFYYVSSNPREPTAHFRHEKRANVIFCDGHVGRERPVAGSIDQRLPSQWVGRLHPETLLLE